MDWCVRTYTSRSDCFSSVITRECYGDLDSKSILLDRPSPMSARYGLTRPAKTTAREETLQAGWKRCKSEIKNTRRQALWVNNGPTIGGSADGCHCGHGYRVSQAACLHTRSPCDATAWQQEKVIQYQRHAAAMKQMANVT